MAIYEIEHPLLVLGAGLGGVLVCRSGAATDAGALCQYPMLIAGIIGALAVFVYGSKNVSPAGVSGLSWLPDARTHAWNDIGALSWEIGWTFSVVLCRKDRDKPVRVATALFGRRKTRLRRLTTITDRMARFAVHAEVDVRIPDLDAFGVDLIADSASKWWPARRRELRIEP